MSKDVNFAKLDKDFAYIKDGTTLIQRTILSMACHFPDGMRYDNIALGKIFQVSDNRISHLVNGLDKKGFTKILLPRSKYRIIYLNPDNSTLVKIAKYHENDPDLHCSKQPSTKCLHCYFHQSTLVKTANSIKEVIKVKDNKGDSLEVRDKHFSESKPLKKSVASEVPPPPNGDFETYWNSKEKLPAIKSFTPGRVKKLRARMAEPIFRDNWQAIIDKLNRSDFHTGGNDRRWRADVDWLLKNDTNYIKIWEGEFRTERKGWT